MAQIRSIPADDLMDALPDGGRVLSDSPAARRARERRAGIKAGTIHVKPHGKRRASARRGAARASLAPEIAATLTMLNMAVLITPLGSRAEIVDPSGNVVRAARIGDELDGVEIDLLAKSLDAQCQRSPRFRKQVERFLGAGAAGGLVTVVGLIVTRRAARHGVLPPMLDPMLGEVMAGGDLAVLTDFMPSPEPTPDPDTGELPPRDVDTSDLDGAESVGVGGYDDLA